MTASGVTSTTFLARGAAVGDAVKARSGPVAVSEAKDELCGDPNISGDAVAKCYETKLQGAARRTATRPERRQSDQRVGEVGGELGAAAGNVIAETGSGLVQGLNVEKLLKDLKGNSMFLARRHSSASWP